MRELQFIDYGGLTRLGFFGLSLEEMFPEEAEEDRRINGRFRKFKNIDEISDEDVDYHPDFKHWIPELALGDESDFNPDPADLEPIFPDVIPDEKEKKDRNSYLSKFVPFSHKRVRETKFLSL